MCNHSPSGDVTGQFTPAPPTCSGETFTFTCNITGDSNGITIWRVGGNATWSVVGNRECPLIHRASSTSICGPNNVFTANSGTGFQPSATSFPSTLSGTATPALNGTLVECFGLANSVDSGYLVGKGMLKLRGQLVFTYLEVRMAYMVCNCTCVVTHTCYGSTNSV